MSNIDLLIQEYEFNDEALIKEIVQRTTSGELVERINKRFIEESVPEKLGWLLELVQDILCCRNSWVKRRYSNNFRRHLDASDFSKILDRKVISDENRLNIAFISFFKYGGPSYLSILRKMFRHALKHDPIEISSIVKEINWLEHNFNWDIIKNLSNSDDYLHRWAVPDIFSTLTVHNNEQFDLKKIGVLRLLSKDSNPFVAQEASAVLSKSLFHQAYLKSQPKSSLARKNYGKRMRPFNKAISDLSYCYTLGHIQICFSRVKVHFSETIPVRDIIEGILMFYWQSSMLNEGHDEWLVRKIKEYMIEKNRKDI